MATWDDVKRIGLALPGVTEATSYGTPSLKAGKTFLTRLRAEDGAAVIKMPIDERDMRMEAAPDIYFITEHYRAWPTVLVRLDKVSVDELATVLTRSYRENAPRSLLKQLDGGAAAPSRSKKAR